MRILICGGRDTDLSYEQFYRLMVNQISEIDDWYSIVIIHGGARGIDSYAHTFAKYISCDRIVYPADWKTHGRAAGPIRNKQMLDEGKPDLVIAFPGGAGTNNMIAQAQKAGVKVIQVELASTRLMTGT